MRGEGGGRAGGRAAAGVRRSDEGRRPPGPRPGSRGPCRPAARLAREARGAPGRRVTPRASTALARAASHGREPVRHCPVSHGGADEEPDSVSVLLSAARRREHPRARLFMPLCNGRVLFTITELARPSGWYGPAGGLACPGSTGTARAARIAGVGRSASGRRCRADGGESPVTRPASGGRAPPRRCRTRPQGGGRSPGCGVAARSASPPRLRVAREMPSKGILRRRCSARVGQGPRGRANRWSAAQLHGCCRLPHGANGRGGGRARRGCVWSGGL